MGADNMNSKIKEKLIKMQKDEITEYHIYKKLASKLAGDNNAAVLNEIAEDEKRHYNIWKEYTGVKVKPSRIKIFFYYFLARILGITFGIKLMELGEESAQESYYEITDRFEEAKTIFAEEDEHEHKLIAMLEEEKLEYAGSIVLGLNDALVELTGTLAGLSFAMRETDIIALAGTITGIAAAFSMAASEYLSTKTEEGENALRASIYTGTAYLLTVIVLIAPYLIFSSYITALAVTILSAVLIIFIFNFYISVAKDLDFKKRFIEMTVISLGVAAFSFFIGYFIRIAFGIDI